MSEFEVHVHACSSKINHYPELCAQKCPLNVQNAVKYTKTLEFIDFLIYQIVRAILVGFPQTVLLDPLEIYYSSHPDTPWKFASLDPHPSGTSSNLPWGRYGYFLEPHIWKRNVNQLACIKWKSQCQGISVYPTFCSSKHTIVIWAELSTNTPPSQVAHIL